jgi:hypothetical protein
VSPEEVLERLAELAREAGLRVREVRGASGQDWASRSGVCRLGDGLYVVLVSSEPVEDRIAVLARGLRVHRPEVCEATWLPPAVRERLESAG